MSLKPSVYVWVIFDWHERLFLWLKRWLFWWKHSFIHSFLRFQRFRRKLSDARIIQFCSFQALTHSSCISQCWGTNSHTSFCLIISVVKATVLTQSNHFFQRTSVLWKHFLLCIIMICTQSYSILETPITDSVACGQFVRFGAFRWLKGKPPKNKFSFFGKERKVPFLAVLLPILLPKHTLSSPCPLVLVLWQGRRVLSPGEVYI